MGIIKNLILLTDIKPDNIAKMEMAATLHKTQENISFKVAEYDNEKIIIRVAQDKTATGTYHTQKSLVELVHKTFDSFFEGKKVIVNPIAFSESPVEKVNIKWINKKMLEMGIRLKDIAKDTGLDYTELGNLIGGETTLSKPMKALFYYYFLSKSL